MVCIRCKMVVKTELANLHLAYSSLELGEVELIKDILPDESAKLKAALLKSGLELMDDKRSILIEKIKAIIIELVHYSEEPLIMKFSAYLSEKMHHNYTYLANVFSEVHGTSIEKFLITQRIERVKELLVYNELSLTDIAYQMHYSSVAHLSNQFKKVTGLTPSFYKKLSNHRRSVLTDI